MASLDLLCLVDTKLEQCGDAVLSPPAMASISHQPTEPASHRAPVEIWSRILALAISCPLLPSYDDSLIPSLYLLQYDCETVAAYWDTERFRLSCRLVCKSWKSLLDHYADRLFIPSNWSSPLPFFQRIQFAPDSIQWAPCRLHGLVNGHCPLRGRRHPINPSIGRTDPNTVQAFVDRISSSTHTMGRLAMMFPGLRLLSLEAFEGSWEHPVSLESLSSKYASLTHLALYLFFQTVKGESQVLALPNLHTLFVHFVTGNSETRPVPLSRWILPKLRNLGIRANLVTSGEQNYNEVRLLIKIVGSHLKGLSFLWMYAGHERNIADLFWEWCPQVKYLEISIHGICALWPPPDSHIPLVMVLMNLKNEVYWESDLIRYLTLLAHITSSPNPRTYGHSFGMPISWSTFRRYLDAAIFRAPQLRVPRVFLQLFEYFQAHGYPFIDRYGVGIEGEEAQAIIRWLKEKYDLMGRIMTDSAA